MANAVDSPLPPRHDNRRACPQSGRLLREFINKGVAEFLSVVEIIRILDLEKQHQGQRLITDFIKFRHLTAHKGVSDIGYLQMMGAFVNYCQKNVLPNDVVAPKTTIVLAEEFPRMADINVVVCATWCFNINKSTKVKRFVRKSLARSLDIDAKNSSFSDYHFNESNNDIIVTHRGKKKPFDGNLLKELAEVLKISVKYTQEEIDKFEELYKDAATIARAESTHTEVQGVLREFEIGCTCPMADLAEGVQNMKLK